MRGFDQGCFLLSQDIWRLKREDTLMLSHSHLGQDQFGTALTISQQWIAHMGNI